MVRLIGPSPQRGFGLRRKGGMQKLELHPWYQADVSGSVMEGTGMPHVGTVCVYEYIYIYMYTQYIDMICGTL